MKRAIYSIPAGQTLESLTPGQQAAIAIVDAQFVNPQPGTVVHDARQVVDGIVADSFDPAVLPGLGLTDWVLLGLWQWDEVSPALAVIQPLDMDTYMAFVPEVQEVDGEGNVTGTHPAERRLQHSWSGWPQPS